MGDWSFFRILDNLTACAVPLISGQATAPAEDRFEEAEPELTMAGEDVLAGEDDHIAMSGIDRWWAGTRLTGHTVWRYDHGVAALVAPGDDPG